eukprot:TRINITY_DN4309_c0_g1_i1.p1 TRINITY_DN4309_c0_g1~~TRINITY_DN4309_c0_g1_i1.p1  ORF type:complete len:350 (+),score=109.14 TRINITY_DN4309_c0_g1_i1:81-1052(+)
MDLTRKPKNARSKRALKWKQPKVVENVKTALILKAEKTSDVVNQLLTDFTVLKKPDSHSLHKKNKIRPFEDASSLEFLSSKNDASLFLIGSHSKKRPHNITIGRTFEYQILDMIEFGVENFKSIESFKGSKPAIGSKPCFVFIGEDFDQKEEYKKFANIIVDFFRGRQVGSISLSGLDHVIICTSADNKIYFRHYFVSLKKSGSKLPKIVLEEVGPSADITLRRTRFAAPDLLRIAAAIPKELKPKKVRNVSRNTFGDKFGAVHPENQDINKLQTRKVKALKRKKGEEGEGEKGEQAKEASTEKGEEKEGQENGGKSKKTRSG